MKKFVLLSCSLALTHHVAQGIAWNVYRVQGAAAVNGWTAAPWRLLSFPLFWVAPGNLQANLFWLISWLNSAVRCLVGSLVLMCAAGVKRWLQR